MKSAALLTDGNEGNRQTKTITREGVRYFPRQDITVVLVMGIDRYGKVQPSEVNKAGGVDMISLLVFDDRDQCARVLSLNRDTMMNIRALDENGRPVNSFVGQLTYSHMYGTGMEDSCENTRKAVSDFLYGIKIDYYLSMNMDAISIMNDAVGGVTVQVTEDFSDVDASIPMGEVTLRGDQAITFVRSRKNLGDQLNASRMERQKRYMDAFLKTMREKTESSDTFALKLYSEVQPYMVTDISSNVFGNLLQQYSDYTLEDIYIPEGEYVLGEEFMEFYVDEEKLDSMILQLFYAPK
jgi:LCP family protein required for cell wall assembly